MQFYSLDCAQVKLTRDLHESRKETESLKNEVQELKREVEKHKRRVEEQEANARETQSSMDTQMKKLLIEKENIARDFNVMLN